MLDFGGSGQQVASSAAVDTDDRLRHERLTFHTVLHGSWIRAGVIVGAVVGVAVFDLVVLQRCILVLAAVATKIVR